MKAQSFRNPSPLDFSALGPRLIQALARRFHALPRFGHGTLFIGGVFLLSSMTLACSCFIQTTRYAVYHDELWNHPAALSLLHGKSWRPAWEVSFFGFPLPLVSGPYQGSLKTFLVVPFLAIFGTSPGVLRGIHCLFGICYLVGLLWALRATAAKRIAPLVLLLPLVDPNFTMFVPTDQGPFLIQNLLLGIAFGCFLRFEQSRSKVWFLAGLAASSLALADKLTGFPVILPLYLLFFWNGLSLSAGRPKELFLASLATTFPLLPHLAYFARQGVGELKGNIGAAVVQASSVSYLERLQTAAAELLRHLGSGSHMPSALAGKAPPDHYPFLPLFGAIMILVGVVMAFLRHQLNDRQILFAALWFVLGLLSFAAVPGLNRPWHYLALHPSFVIASFLSAQKVFTHLRERKNSRLYFFGLLGLFVLASGYNARRTYDLLGFLRARSGVYIASPGLYTLFDSLKALKVRRIVCLNYSLCNPLYVLFGGKVEVVDLTWAKLSEQTESHFETLLSQPGTVGVYRTIRYPVHPWEQTKVDWLNGVGSWLLQRLAAHPEIRRVIVFHDGHADFGLVLQKRGEQA